MVFSGVANCYIAGNVFPTARALRGHMTYNNETVSRQNLSADNIVKVYDVRE